MFTDVLAQDTQEEFTLVYLWLLLPPPPSAASIAVCQFASRAEEWYVVVGTGRDVVLGPRTNSGGSLILYQLAEDGCKLKYLHTTPLDDVPLALEPFNGRLLVGVGKLLRIYDIGKKKMLRKCENKVGVRGTCVQMVVLAMCMNSTYMYIGVCNCTGVCVCACACVAACLQTSCDMKASMYYVHPV